MQEVTKTLEVILHTAKLPDYNRALDDSLALAPSACGANLEKRLAGLTEIKDLINISMRKLSTWSRCRNRRNAEAPPSPSAWTILICSWTGFNVSKCGADLWRRLARPGSPPMPRGVAILALRGA